MKIVTIFAEKLFSFHYKGEAENEFDRLMELWTDVQYLKDFAKKNGVENEDIESFVEKRLAEADEVQDLLDEIDRNEKPLEYYFRPLFDTETGYKILSFQKGKISKNKLRIYALKIEDNLYVITGGAIKMSQKMKDHPGTKKELNKLNTAKSYLNKNGVFDEDSFYELLNENK